MWLYFCLKWQLPDCGCPSVFMPAQVTGLSRTVCFPLLQKCLVILFANPSWRECQPPPDPPFLWAEPHSELWTAGLCPWLLWVILSFCLPDLQTTCFNALISQTCLCTEQGIFCLITGVQIDETSKGETKGISHSYFSDVMPWVTFNKRFNFYLVLQFRWKHLHAYTATWWKFSLWPGRYF